MLIDLAISETAASFLIFVRIGAILAFLPGFSVAYVNARVRLLLALMISLMLTPVLAPELPVLPADPSGLAALLLGEALIGVFLALIPRAAIAALQTAGTLTAYFASLTSAIIQDPVADQQSSTLAGFFGVLGLVLIFVTDLHHLMLQGLIASYQTFPAGEGLMLGDASEVLTRAVAQSFAIGLQLSIPSLVGCILSNVALGLLGRLMPHLNVFFFGLPLQISLQMFILMLTFSGMGIVFLNFYAESLSVFGSS